MVDQIPLIISILGSILGAILGTVVGYCLNNNENLEVSKVEFLDKKSDNSQYAYNLCLFIHNHSYKPVCIKNLKVIFTGKRRRIVFESMPRLLKNEGFDNIHSSDVLKIINSNINNPAYYILGDMIDGHEFELLGQVKSINLVFEHKSSTKRKLVVEKNFSIDTVSKLDGSKGFYS